MQEIPRLDGELTRGRARLEDLCELQVWSVEDDSVDNREQRRGVDPAKVDKLVEDGLMMASGNDRNRPAAATLVILKLAINPN